MPLIFIVIILDKILVVFRCFGEILKTLFVSRSFRDIHRSSEGILGYYGGILWYSWVNVWTGDGVATEFTKVVFIENKSLLSYPQKAQNLNTMYMICSGRNPLSKLDL